jgi:NTE family protein
VTVFADLVLEGGGVKGIALVGAISVLEERGYQFRRVAGTSAGAIVGSLVAANARAAELEEIMRGVDYRQFRDGPRWRGLFLGKAAALMFQQGIYEGQFVKDWLGERLGRLGVHTFADLAYHDPERPPDPEHAYRLVVMTCDISQGCLRRLPWEYDRYGLPHADQPVVDAVRASVSIPFFYKPARLTDAYGNDCWLVDGAMVSRFPIGVFDVPPGLEPRWPTFGIRLGAAPGPVEVNGTKSMSWAMLNTMTGFYDRLHIDDAAAAAQTIVIDTGTVRATDFNLDRDTQDLLFRKGREAALDFLDGTPGRPGWDWEAYKRRYRSLSPVLSAARPARDAIRSLRYRLYSTLRTGTDTSWPAGLLKLAAARNDAQVEQRAESRTRSLWPQAPATRHPFRAMISCGSGWLV